MKKYFFISDIHSFYKAALNALEKSGFELDNPEHILVVCGDIFDRGGETVELYKWLKSIPKKRRIFIKGNHEYLYLALLKKNKPDYYDFSNGTVKTFCHIAKVDYESFRSMYHYYSGTYFDNEWVDDAFYNLWDKILQKVEKSRITQWLRSNEWRMYFELGKYIAVHSWVPTVEIPWDDTDETDRAYYYLTGKMRSVLMTDWKEKATEEDWESATWGCPWRFARDKQNPEGKIIICGHWHASDFHEYLGLEPNGGDNYNIYFGENVIALDACTAYTGFCNVLVIDEEFNCFDQFGNKLEVQEKRKEKE